jgi:hypothetical protein
LPPDSGKTKIVCQYHFPNPLIAKSERLHEMAIVWQTKL